MKQRRVKIHEALLMLEYNDSHEITFSGTGIKINGVLLAEGLKYGVHRILINTAQDYFLINGEMVNRLPDELRGKYSKESSKMEEENSFISELQKI